MLWNEKLTTVAVAHFRKALDAYRAGANIRQKLAELDPANESTQYALSVSHVKYAGVERARGDIAAALLSYRAAIDIRQRLAAGRPDAYGASLASLRFLVGDLYGDQGKPAAAIASYRTGVGIPRARVANDPNDSQSQLDMVYGLRRIGGTEAGRGDIAAALKANREALAIVAKFAVADPRNENLRREANAVAHEIERLERRRRGEPDPPRRAFAFPVDALPESFWRLAPGADNLGAARARDVKVPQGDDTGEPTH
jgi:tetratricopeptide (TPR) repeat protein